MKHGDRNKFNNLNLSRMVWNNVCAHAVNDLRLSIFMNYILPPILLAHGTVLVLTVHGTGTGGAGVGVTANPYRPTGTIGLCLYHGSSRTAVLPEKR